MRILFLSSSLEPGQDGVGDHVRLLAAACARRGHETALLALHDPHLVEPGDSFVDIEGAKIPTLRLPAAMPWPRRVELARAFREKFQPDWSSFHVVPYAYHPRGLLFDLASKLQALTAGIPLHLMFHELWVGAGSPAPWHHRVTGFLQREGVRRLLQRLQPRWVTTSNPVYAAMLKSLGVEASVLPLCGNIPVVPAGARERADALPAPLEIIAQNRGEWWLGLFFGALHGQWKPEPLMGPLLRAAGRAGKRVCLVSAGRMGRTGEVIWERLGEEQKDRVTFINVGEQPPEAVSALLQLADFGVAASPWQLIGKSGAAAAMLDHGLPVIVTREDFHPRLQPDAPPSTDPLLHRCNADLENKLAAGLAKRPAHAQVDEVAAKMCSHLEAATSSPS